MNEADRDNPAWSQHERDQRERWLRLTALERLRWLDGAKRFASLVASGANKEHPSNSDS